MKHELKLHLFDIINILISLSRLSMLILEYHLFVMVAFHFLSQLYRFHSIHIPCLCLLGHCLCTPYRLLSCLLIILIRVYPSSAILIVFSFHLGRGECFQYGIPKEKGPYKEASSGQETGRDDSLTREIYFFMLVVVLIFHLMYRISCA